MSRHAKPVRSSADSEAFQLCSASRPRWPRPIAGGGRRRQRHPPSEREAAHVDGSIQQVFIEPRLDNGGKVLGVRAQITTAHVEGGARTALTAGLVQKDLAFPSQSLQVARPRVDPLRRTAYQYERRSWREVRGRPERAQCHGTVAADCERGAAHAIASAHSASRSCTQSRRNPSAIYALNGDHHDFSACGHVCNTRGRTYMRICLPAETHAHATLTGLRRRLFVHDDLIVVDTVLCQPTHTHCLTLHTA
eukprot:scaffold123716_cov69-Phaeocystis_antarctica.AAC.1